MPAKQLIDIMYDRYKLLNDDLLAISFFYSEYSKLANWNFLNKYLKDTGTIQEMLKHYDLKFVHQMLSGNTHKCSVCGKICLKKYETCSRKCQGKSIAVNEKRKATNLLKYGAKNPRQSEVVSKKIENTCMKKYNARSPFHSKLIQQQAKNSCIEHYGVPKPMQSSEIKQKFRDTCKARYGTTNVFQVDSVKQKIKATNLLKYGVFNDCSTSQQNLKSSNKRKQYELIEIKYNELIQSNTIEDSLKLLLKEFTVRAVKEFISHVCAEHKEPLMNELNRIEKSLKPGLLWEYLKGKTHPCPVCGTLCINDTCSNRCAQLNPRTKEKIKATNLLKYGETHALKNKSIREKQIKTNLERYGAPVSFQSNDVKQKIKDTCVTRYGVKNPMQSEEIKERARNTCIEKYGAKYPMQLDAIKQKFKDTCIKRYGVKNPMQLDSTKEKIKDTCIERYGVEHPMQLDSTKEKIRDTNLERYGVLYSAQVETPNKPKEIKGKSNKYVNCDFNELKQALQNETDLSVFQIMRLLYSTRSTEFDEIYNSLNLSDTLSHKPKHTILSMLVLNRLKQCTVCGKLHDIKTMTCSRQCQGKLDGVKQNRKATCLKRYGSENVFQSEEFKKRIRATCVARYGVENVFQSEEFKKRIKDTCIEKYGVEYPLQSESIKQKVKDTNLERYGTEYPVTNAESHENSRRTNLERYGVEYPLQSESIKQKVKDTNLERYGAEYPLQSDNFKQKIQELNLERYGVMYPLQSESIKQKAKDTNLERYGSIDINNCVIPKTFMQRNYRNTEELNFEGCQKFIKDGFFDIHDFAEYFNMSVSNAYKYRRKLKIETPCSDSGASRAEKELSEFIESVLDEYCAKHKIPKVNVLKNDRSVINPLELDIYIPELKLAIEYNGIYWHSLKDKFYHQTKSMLCYNKGIRLIHVYEEIDDFDSIKKLLKTVITSKLSNEHLCVTQESFKESLKIDLSKDDPFIPGYSIKEILEPIQISENLYNAGYFVLQKNL